MSVSEGKTPFAPISIRSMVITWPGKPTWIALTVEAIRLAVGIQIYAYTQC